MNRRVLLVVGLVALAALVIGLLGADYPLARWVGASDAHNSVFFADGLYALDTVFGMRIWFWLAACVCVGLGFLGLVLRRHLPLPASIAPVLLAAGITQAATIALMILGKTQFARLRPHQVLETGDWTNVWFAGGGSFPSGHSAFYFGLLLPLAAAAPQIWQRVALLAIPLFAICARMNMSMHFLSDVSASAVIAATCALLVATAWQRLQRARM